MTAYGNRLRAGYYRIKPKRTKTAAEDKTEAKTTTAKTPDKTTHAG